MPSGIGVGCETLETEWCVVETLLQLCFLIVGVSVYALAVGEAASIVSHMDEAAAKYEHLFTQVNDYMRTKKLPNELRDHIREFFLMRFEKGKIYDEEEIMALLPPMLRYQILEHNAHDTFEKVPLFRFAPEGAKLYLARCMHASTAFAGDVIFEIGTTAESLYFIFSGDVEIFIPVDHMEMIHDGTAAGTVQRARSSSMMPRGRGASVTKQGEATFGDTVVAKLSGGCFFGECGILLPHATRRSASARVLDGTCDMYALLKTKFLDFLTDYPNLKKHLSMIAGRRLARVRFRRGLLDHLPASFMIDSEDVRAGRPVVSEHEEKADASRLYALDTSDHDRRASTFRPKSGGRSTRGLGQRRRSSLSGAATAGSFLA